MRLLRPSVALVALAHAFALAALAEQSAAAQAPPAATPAEPAPPDPKPDVPYPPIPPAPAPGKEPAPGAPSDPSTNEADKRIGVGIDALFVVPVGNFSDETGAIAGPVLRFGYRVIPMLEIALRAGYIFANKRTTSPGVKSKVDILPLWLGARLFLWKPFVGPYVALEGGMNTHLPTQDPTPAVAGGDKLTELRRRFGGNVGAGYLLSPDLPIDVRAQVMLLNLIGQDAALKESLNVGVSLSAGYTFQF